MGNIGRAGGEGGVDRTGARDQADEGDEPGDGLPRTDEQQCPQGGRDRPEANCRGRLEAAETPL